MFYWSLVERSKAKKKNVEVKPSPSDINLRIKHKEGVINCSNLKAVLKGPSNIFCLIWFGLVVRALDSEIQ